MTDYYYAELTGTTGNWDNPSGLNMMINSNDRYPEVFVGRIPYYGVISDLDAILRKTITFESTPNNWYNRVVLAMKPLDDHTKSYQLGEQIKDNLLIPNGYSFSRIYDDEYNLSSPAERIPCSYDNVKAAKEEAPTGALIWQTHGSPTISANIMDSTVAATLSNSYPSFTFQASCQNSCPELSNNLSYTLLKNGAVNTIGATRNSYYIPTTSYTNNHGVGGIAYQYAKNLFVEKMSAGEALGSVLYNYQSHGVYQWTNLLVSVIYGDPSLSLQPDDYSNTLEEADICFLNRPQKGSIHYPGDIDYFKVYIQEPGNYKIMSTGSANHYGELQDSDGSYICSDNESGEDDGFCIRRNLAAGIYYIKTTSINKGDYEVVIAKEVPINKEWRIDVNKTLLSATINSETVFVTDSNDVVIPVGVSVENNGKTIIVTPPVGNYDLDGWYYIHVTTGIKSEDEDEIGKELIHCFTTHP